MPAWLVAIIANLVLKYGVQFLESRYPGLKPFLDQVLAWLDAQPNKAEAIQSLSSHCEGLYCQPDTKGLG